MAIREMGYRTENGFGIRLHRVKGITWFLVHKNGTLIDRISVGEYTYKSEILPFLNDLDGDMKRAIIFGIASMERANEKEILGIRNEADFRLDALSKSRRRVLEILQS